VKQGSSIRAKSSIRACATQDCQFKMSGDHSWLDTPVPFSNTEVKQLAPMILGHSEKVGCCRTFLEELHPRSLTVGVFVFERVEVTSMTDQRARLRGHRRCSAVPMFHLLGWRCRDLQAALTLRFGSGRGVHDHDDRAARKWRHLRQLKGFGTSTSSTVLRQLSRTV
jgi:hypothetical protein